MVVLFPVFIQTFLFLAAGDLRRQRPCDRANNKPDDKFVETATTYTASIDPGINMVVLAASATACIAVDSTIVILLRNYLIHILFLNSLK